MCTRAFVPGRQYAWREPQNGGAAWPPPSPGVSLAAARPGGASCAAPRWPSSHQIPPASPGGLPAGGALFWSGAACRSPAGMGRPSVAGRAPPSPAPAPVGRQPSLGGGLPSAAGPGCPKGHQPPGLLPAAGRPGGPSGAPGAAASPGAACAVSAGLSTSACGCLGTAPSPPGLAPTKPPARCHHGSAPLKAAAVCTVSSFLAQSPVSPFPPPAGAPAFPSANCPRNGHHPCGPPPAPTRPPSPGAASVKPPDGGQDCAQGTSAEVAGASGCRKGHHRVGSALSAGNSAAVEAASSGGIRSSGSGGSSPGRRCMERLSLESPEPASTSTAPPLAPMTAPAAAPGGPPINAPVAAPREEAAASTPPPTGLTSSRPRASRDLERQQQPASHSAAISGSSEGGCGWLSMSSRSSSSSGSPALSP
mmetsp:Transcript_30819/g.77809  ORF Transcript_30819/g.77809 Transcript_30819/m.77809 type:complete len:421 (-) Transcript_30819:605-1867(-)